MNRGILWKIRRTLAETRTIPRAFNCNSLLWVFTASLSALNYFSRYFQSVSISHRFLTVLTVSFTQLGHQTLTAALSHHEMDLFFGFGRDRPILFRSENDNVPSIHYPLSFDRSIRTNHLPAWSLGLFACLTFASDGQKSQPLDVNSLFFI